MTRLRVHFLVARAQIAGYGDAADEVAAAWQSIADVIGVPEDDHGFDDDALAPAITRTVDDMLVEADPRPHRPEEAQGGGWEPDRDSPVRLLNWAWQVRRAGTTDLATRQTRQIGRLLA